MNAQQQLIVAQAQELLRRRASMTNPQDDDPEVGAAAAAVQSHVLPTFTEEDERRELSALTPVDILRVESDILGVGPSLGDLAATQARRLPRHVDVDLQLLQLEINRVPAGQKPAYLAACHTSSPCRAEALASNHTGRNRHIAFLEAAAFDSAIAARKVIVYWAERFELFGPERAFLTMNLHGAMKDEVEWMIASNVAQILPFRDRSGRTIIFGDPSRKNLTLYETRRQNMAMWYLLETIIEDTESRERGIVVISSAKYSGSTGMDLRFAAYTRRLVSEIFPVHLRSIHFCYPSRVAHFIIFPALKFLLGRDFRLRLKTHYGTDEQVLLQLETFGLHRSILPRELGGQVHLDHRKWVHQRLAQEYAFLVSKKVLPLPRSNTMTAPCYASSPANALYSTDGADLSSTETSRRDLKFRGKRSSEEGSFPVPPRRKKKSKEVIRSKPVKRLTDTAREDLSALESVLNETEVPKSGKKKVGRRADPRMNRAVRIKLRNPDLPPFDALVQGGYDFPPLARGSSAHDIYDSENVSLHQRKNQLCRRVRQLREKQEKDKAKERAEEEADAKLAAEALERAGEAAADADAAAAADMLEGARSESSDDSSSSSE